MFNSPSANPHNTIRPAQSQAEFSVLFMVVVSCLVWTLMQKVAYPPLDSRHDMLENFGWSQLATWGTHKHPPFFSWVVGAWFWVMPHKAVSTNCWFT